MTFSRSPTTPTRGRCRRRRRRRGKRTGEANNFLNNYLCRRTDLDQRKM